MTVAGVVWWRWLLFAVYLVLVALVLVAVVALVVRFPGLAAGVLFAWLVLVLAWPHRWFLAAWLLRPFRGGR